METMCEYCNSGLAETQRTVEAFGKPLILEVCEHCAELADAEGVIHG